MRIAALIFCQLIWFVPKAQAQLPEGETIAHLWNEEVLEGIRNDFARPTVHARNLYHASILMYDSWAAYDTTQSQTIFLGQEFDGYFCPFDEGALEIPADLDARKEVTRKRQVHTPKRLSHEKKLLYR